MKLNLLLVIMLCFALPFPPSEEQAKETSYGKILYVGGSGPNNYTSIQQAIDNASDGDTIFVYDDSSPYYEEIIINKSINLVGENRETTIIYGNKSKYPPCNIIIIRANHVNISNFKLTSNLEPEERKRGRYSVTGIFIKSANIGYGTVYGHIRIENCNFTERLYEGILGGGEAHNVTIVNCIFWRAVLFTSKGENWRILNCFFYRPFSFVFSLKSENSTVSNCTFDHTYAWTLEAHHSKFLNNFFYRGGLQIGYTYHMILRNNTFIESFFDVHGFELEHYVHDIDSSNTIQGKPILYLFNKRDIIIDEDTNTGYIILVKCKNIEIRNKYLFATVLAFSSNCKIENCGFYANYFGMWILNSSDNTVFNCKFKNPLRIELSCRNKISHCMFRASIEVYHQSNENIFEHCILEGYGLMLVDAHRNSIIACSVSNAEIGIDVDGTFNSIYFCNLSNNHIGIFAVGYLNKVYLNNFFNNSINAFCYGWHVWKKNYWDDYRGFDLNGDGMGELPYHIKTDLRAVFPLYIESFFNFDFRPLMQPV